MDPESQPPDGGEPSGSTASLAPPPGAPLGLRLSAWLERAWPQLDARAYLVWSALVVGVASSVFVRAMLEQTSGEWSAPLDDVFIHFDYARSTARGYPFQWSEGNGFSSGNTSLSYPFVLALGYWVGFRGEHLMPFAIGVACASLLFFFAASRSLLDPLGRWAKYLLPPAVLSLGALDWSFFSGMENAFHLGVWGLSLSALDWLRARPSVARAWVTGATLALLVLTRPESVVCVAVFGVAVAVHLRHGGAFRALVGLVATGTLPALALGAQSLANRLLTGEWSQAGALAKLALHHPYMTREAKWDDWLFHLKYVLARTTEHHFADAKPWGYLVPLAAALPLLSRELRGRALFLWAQVALWAVVVSLNGQVRWQNERYVMSAVAWLMVLAGMGVAVLLRGFGRSARNRALWGARAAVAVALVTAYWTHQRPNFRDQVWFFARACRNIRDQHVVAGKVLREMGAKRVLVGDAGALLYASDLPGLDIIGLGGYHDYPFARATRFGIGSSIELIERMSDEERPDVMAIYPSWWGDLPIVFGHYLGEIPVVGNVICGGAAKVLYRADWSALDRGGLPRSLRAGERVVDAVDVADLMDEKPHRYERPGPTIGFVVWRVLGDPSEPSRDLFDAGRIVPPGTSERFEVDLPPEGGRLIVRSVPTKKGVVRVSVDGRVLGDIGLEPADTWAESSTPLPAGLPQRATVALEAVDQEWVDFHVWVVAER